MQIYIRYIRISFKVNLFYIGNHTISKRGYASSDSQYSYYKSAGSHPWDPGSLRALSTLIGNKSILQGALINTMNIYRPRIIPIIITICILLFLPDMQKAVFAATSGAKEKYREANSAYVELSRDASLRKDKANWVKVVQKFDDVTTGYPESSFAPKALYMEGKLYEQIYGYFFRKADLEEAVKAYKTVVSKYPDSGTVPDALFREAKVYEVRLREKKKAIELYHEIVKKYPRGDISWKARAALHSLEKKKNGGEEKAPDVDNQEGTDLKHKETKQSDKTLDRNEDAITVDKDNTPSQVMGNQSSVTNGLSRKISKIVIDPGHGGKDTGAIGPDGEKEKDQSQSSYSPCHICNHTGPCGGSRISGKGYAQKGSTTCTGGTCKAFET